MTASERPVVNLAALAYRDSAFTVKHPISGEAIGSIAVASPAHGNVIAFDDAEWRKAHEAAMEYQRAERERLRSPWLEAPTPIGADLTPADLRERMHRRLAVHVLGADFKVKLGGNVVDFGPDIAFTVFNDPAFVWLTAAFHDFIETKANFIGDDE